MKHTRENLLKLLKAEREHAYRMATYWRQRKNEVQYHSTLTEISNLNDMIALMEDKEYFNQRVIIYKDLLEEAK